MFFRGIGEGSLGEGKGKLWGGFRDWKLTIVFIIYIMYAEVCLYVHAETRVGAKKTRRNGVFVAFRGGNVFAAEVMVLVLFVSWGVYRRMVCVVFMPVGRVVFVRWGGCCFSVENVKNMKYVVGFMTKGNV